VFSCIYFMVCIFILWKYKYGIKVPGFPRNVANTYMYICIGVCVCVCV
jgi:hypothetical protein